MTRWEVIAERVVIETYIVEAGSEAEAQSIVERIHTQTLPEDTYTSSFGVTDVTEEPDDGRYTS